MNTKRTILYVVPLALFLILAILLFIGLGKEPSIIPSPLIGKPAPSFTLKNLHREEEQVNPIERYKGQPWMLNVWASWCTSCRIEHPVFTETRTDNSDWIFVGLNYQDRPEEARAWLEQLGDPYTLSVEDIDGRVGIDWGVYGVPETFIIDAQGIIRYKHIGPVSSQDMKQILLPILTSLETS